MSSFAFFSEPTIPRLPRLLAQIRAGEIRIPRFQRPFVWTDEQRLSLVDSIYRRYPIGSVLVWRTAKHRLKTYEKLGNLSLPNDGDNVIPGPRQYLLDGHQRMTTLFAALGPALYSAADEKIPEVLPPTEKQKKNAWPIYFDLEASDEDDTLKLLPRRAERPDTWLPLAILFDSYAVRGYEEQLRAGGQPKDIINRVQSVVDAFRDYTVPVMPIVSEDIRQVTTSFKRVNSGGTTMNEEHMVNALTWTKDFDLQARLDELLTSLNNIGWGTFQRQMFLNICKANNRLDLQRATPEALATLFRDEPKHLDRGIAALERAATTLKHAIHIHGPSVLPYSYQAVVLATCLPHNQRLSAEKLKQIGDWFWITTLTGHFGGMNSAQFRRTITHFEQLLLGARQPRPPEASEVVDAFRRFDFRTARSRGLALLLADLDPKDEQGNSVNAFRSLAVRGTSFVPRLLGRKDIASDHYGLLAGPENRFVVAPEKVNSIRAHLLTDSENVMATAASHAITAEALEAFRRSDMLMFLHLRRAAIEALEREKAEAVGLRYRTE